MTSASLNLRRVILVLALTIYLILPVFMGIKGGFIEGFLPVLLWPMPVLVAIIGLGSIPLWAGTYSEMSASRRSGSHRRLW